MWMNLLMLEMKYLKMTIPKLLERVGRQFLDGQHLGVVAPKFIRGQIMLELAVLHTPPTEEPI